MQSWLRSKFFRRDVIEALRKVSNRIEKLDILKNELRQGGRNPANDLNIIQKIDQNNLGIIKRILSDSLPFEGSALPQLIQFPNEALFNHPYIPTEQRISKAVLDSIISEELSRKGIHTPFEFGVFSPLRHRMVYQKTGKYPNKLLNSSLKTPIYSLLNYPYLDELSLYFPEEKEFIYLQIWGVLLISLLFIIIIIISFTTSTITIFKQKKIEEMKNDFINNMTHELKTPISTISLACQAFGDNDIQMSDDLRMTYIGMISEENTRLQKMVEKVLQTAVIEKGQLKLNIETIDIHTILNDVNRQFELQVKEKGGNITMNLDATKIIGRIDKMHLTNSFSNLIDNAIKYTLKGPEIVISTKDDKEGIIISIKDNGIGISKSNQKKIFQKLYRVHSGNIHNFKGFGLGLSYVKSIIELHQGNISIESEPKKGSTFYIFLPFN